MKRTLVIGDIHGCHQTFLSLLNKIHLNPESDTVILLGDYIDRGPESKQVIEEIINLQNRVKRVIPLMGNHEQAFLNYLQGNNREFYLMIGGAATLLSYGFTGDLLADNYRKIPKKHLEFFNNLLLYWEDAENIYVHAGLQPGVHLSQQPTEWLLWSRNEFITSGYDFGKRVIFGHTAFREPVIEPHQIGIDTGAIYGGSLTCLILPDLEFVSVPGPKRLPHLPQET
ncbi:MAG: hypothetical protein A2511_11375 [Deltaproteobacteria bacterium RIFOXYD12_FULL_50_9]|nr:MAG: hypothetical protein A2511_11375 [Deltaproteobacteria bacterium RIFOXYD12_FULL_50_9]